MSDMLEWCSMQYAQCQKINHWKGQHNCEQKYLYACLYMCVCVCFKWHSYWTSMIQITKTFKCTGTDTSVLCVWWWEKGSVHLSDRHECWRGLPGQQQLCVSSWVHSCPPGPPPCETAGHSSPSANDSAVPQAAWESKNRIWQKQIRLQI